MEGNNAPFAIGQEVVCLINGFTFKKGDIRKVIKIEKGCCCWLVDIGEISPITVKLTCKCGSGYMYYIVGGKTMMIDSVRLAPIQHQYTDIAREIADTFKQTEEVPDKIIIPEKVNN